MSAEARGQARVRGVHVVLRVGCAACGVHSRSVWLSRSMRSKIVLGCLTAQAGCLPFCSSAMTFVSLTLSTSYSGTWTHFIGPNVQATTCVASMTVDTIFREPIATASNIGVWFMQLKEYGLAP